MKREETTGKVAPSTEAGFTLIEALIAMVILIAGLAAIANLFLVAASSNMIAGLGTETTTQATETMERLKAIPFQTLTAGGSLTADIPGQCYEATATSGGCVVATNFFNMYRDVTGGGALRTRWVITQVTPSTLFITVRSETVGRFSSLTRSEFSTFRSCTTAQCPL